MTSLNYTTNNIDTIVKSCINCQDPHIIFDRPAVHDTLRGIKYLIFPATINFLPQELDNFRCHNCGFSSFYRNGFTPKHFIKVPSVNATYQTAIAARSARIRCRNCNSTCSARSELTEHGCQISKLLKAKIATRLRMDISAKTIAFEEGVSASTVNRTLDSTRCEFRNNSNFLPLHLCFDEFRGTHNTYHFICLDADNHVIQTILPNRLKQTIFRYFMRFPASVRGLVRTDLMNRFDRSSKNYKLFKHNWKLFLKRYDELNCTHQFYERSQRKWVTSERLVNQGLEIADKDFQKAYWDYQRLLEVIADPTPSKLKIFEQCLFEAHQKYSSSRHKASKADKILLTLYDNLIPVITALDPTYCRYNNGPLEGINRKIKQIQRTAYGYRNFEHLKARIYLQTYLGKDTRSSVKTA